MTPPLIIYGAGGHAAVLIDALRLLRREVLFVIDDDPATHGQAIDGIEVRGDTSLLEGHRPGELELVNAIGSVRAVTARRERFLELRKRGFGFATVIHPGALVAASAALGHGVQVMAGAVVQPRATIGANALINTRAAIDHDTVIGPHAHIAPGATLSGGVSVGEASHVGVGASVIQGISIGEHATIGAGAVVLRNVARGATVVGVPARLVD